ncbi:uncharacterized protein LOC119393348 isoform X2 [Rhipicephalus sanguineus]|uniref:uncharacterized protein LOC119393348 isoform X2 n=1 Tax=Rhipicephalus sanguineus TaxID=34632 RepID=UPI0020C1C186|nr:uncharacterized protein LOC119393348 isoform X2 [Rhipicephalus sanguineus]
MVQLYFREYTKTTNGWLNVFEVVIGAILWAMYHSLGATTPSEQFLHSCALVFTTNGLFFLMSSTMSITTALMLPRLFYYNLFELVAAACYIYGGVGSVGNSSFIDGVTAIICGGFHLVHFIYSILKN